MSDTLKAMVVRWREHGACCDTFHATMGVGWKRCADELEALLSEAEAPRAQVLTLPELLDELARRVKAHIEATNEPPDWRAQLDAMFEDEPVAAAPAPAQTCATCGHHDRMSNYCKVDICRPTWHSMFNEWGCTLWKPATVAGDAGEPR